jgi:hypothetical protein
VADADGCQHRDDNDHLGDPGGTAPPAAPATGCLARPVTHVFRLRHRTRRVAARIGGQGRRWPPGSAPGS